MLLKKIIVCKCVDFIITKYFEDIRKILQGILHPNNSINAAEDFILRNTINILNNFWVKNNM